MIDYDAQNWLGILAKARGSVWPRLLGRMFLAGGFGGAAVALEHFTEFQLNPVAHGLIGVALGLLLVFRTNASYDRFWEGRKLVGQLVVATRDLVRQIAAQVDDAEARAELRRLILAFYRLSVQRLREQDDLAAVSNWLTDEERSRLAEVAHRAPVVATWISRRLAALSTSRDGAAGEMRLHRMDQNLTQMITALSGCERIRFTPVPFAYAQHIKLFLTVFCFTSPFAMVGGMGLWTVPAVVVLTLALFGIDEIGVEIEDPFGDDPNDLPLDAIGAGLATATEEMLGAGIE